MKELKTLRTEVNALKKADSKTERSAAKGKSSKPKKRNPVPTVLELTENVSIVGSVEAATIYNGHVLKTSKGLTIPN